MEPELYKALWPIFLEEAREHLRVIGSGLLLLEEPEPEKVQQGLKRTRQAAHSLKGSAGSLGLDNVAKVAHALEEALKTSNAANDPVIEGCFRAVQRLQEGIERAQNNGEVEVQDLSALLASLAGGGEAPASSAEAWQPFESDTSAVLVPVVAEAPEPSVEHTLRVSSRSLDSMVEQVERFISGRRRQERWAQDLAVAAEAMSDPLREYKKLTAVARRDSPGEAYLALMARGIERMETLRRTLARLQQELRSELIEQELSALVLREDLRELRTQPAQTLLEPLRVVVREAAGRLQKRVAVTIVGGELRLERRMLEALKDPLTHLLRNAVDHGLETPSEREAAGKPEVGRIEMRVERRGRRAAVILSDDGRGLNLARIREVAVQRGLLSEKAAHGLSDAEAARLIFRPGFSTAAQVTQLSGRGVGLDVVHDRVTRLLGEVTVDFTPGKGTRFVLDLPLTLASVLSLVVRAGGYLFALPFSMVERLMRFPASTVGSTRTLLAERAEIPCTTLGRLLRLPKRPPSMGPEEGEDPEEGAVETAVLLKLGEQRLLMQVDGILGQRELVLHGAGRSLVRMPHLAATAVLDDGEVVSVVDGPELFRLAARESEGSLAAEVRPKVLVVDDSLTTRSLVKVLLERAGFEVVPATNGAEGLEVLEQQPCELVVSDVEMPRLNGLELTRTLKTDPRYGGLPVLLMSSLSSEADVAAGLDAGADGYFVKKDLMRGAILERIQQLLPRR